MEALLEPFAMTLYRRVLEGETVRQLSDSLSIPEERVNQRVRAAARFWEHHKAQAGLAALGAELDRDRPL
jgi:DNA-directed RNA polymerase specialized sigma24 family protein